MKKTKTILETFALFIVTMGLWLNPVDLLCQNSSYLYLVPLSEDAEPARSKSNQSLNALFSVYGVTAYSQSFPGAKNERLARTCEIHATGDLKALSKALRESGLFAGIEEQGYYKAACSNPVGFNDPHMASFQGSSYAWQLDLIDAKCAWSITPGNPNVLIGVCDTEFRIDHEDFVNKFAYVWNPTGAVVTSPYCYHGTAVSSAAAANVNNNIGVAGIGNKCRIAGYVVPSNPGPNGGCYGNPWNAIWQAYQDGIKVINVSWGGVGQVSSLTVDAIKEMTQNGSILVLAAGENPGSQHSFYANIPGVINVSTVNSENKLGPTGMARNQWVDICTTGGGGLVARADASNAYSTSNSTSASAPIASGVIGLMLSVNSCLSPAQTESIIKATADPIADAGLYPGLYGAGKINAYEAVKAAQMIKHYGYDLFIPDTDYDFGQQPSSNSYPNWASRAIWLRNADDDVETHETIDPALGTAYVYVKVRNIGCQASSGTDMLHVSWAKGAANLGWPWPWNGLQIAGQLALGGLVGTVQIPSIPAGGEATVKVQWNNVPDPANYPPNFSSPFFERGHFCILARVLSSSDPMYHEATTGSNVLDGNVQRNNNIAQKNISILYESNQGVGVVLVGGASLASMTRLNIGNVFGEPDRVFKLSLKVPDNEVGDPITGDADVTLKLDQLTWQKWAAGGFAGSGIGSVDWQKHEVIISSARASISNLAYTSAECSEVALGVSFPSKTSGKEHYNYDLIWSEDLTDAVMGGERFEITRPQHSLPSKPVAITEVPVATIQPVLSPNPSSGLLTVHYPYMSVNSSISFYDNLGRKVQHHILNGDNSIIDISSLSTGIYFYHMNSGNRLFKGRIVKE